jgi:hypothetical protein
MLHPLYQSIRLVGAFFDFGFDFAHLYIHGGELKLLAVEARKKEVNRLAVGRMPPLRVHRQSHETPALLPALPGEANELNEAGLEISLVVEVDEIEGSWFASLKPYQLVPQLERKGNLMLPERVEEVALHDFAGNFRIVLGK